MGENYGEACERSIMLRAEAEAARKRAVALRQDHPPGEPAPLLDAVAFLIQPPDSNRCK
jgi:hypothetical protein